MSIQKYFHKVIDSFDSLHYISKYIFKCLSLIYFKSISLSTRRLSKKFYFIKLIESPTEFRNHIPICKFYHLLLIERLMRGAKFK